MNIFYKTVDGDTLEKIEADDIQEAAENEGYWDYNMIDDDNLIVTGGEEFDEGVSIEFSTNRDGCDL
jgi:hypothetical protein